MNPQHQEAQDAAQTMTDAIKLPENERKDFGDWANAKGYDIACTYDTERSRWLWLNPMTADLWEAWQARAALASTEQAAQQDREDAERWRTVKADPWLLFERWENIALPPEEREAAIDAARAALARGEKG